MPERLRSGLIGPGWHPIQDYPRLTRMRRALALLTATAITTGCSTGAASKTPPTVTVTATASSPAATLSATDHGAAQLACFSWTTFDKAQQAGDANVLKYATTAQESTANMGDPRWARVAELPPAEAMQTLGGLCKEIHYHE